MNPICPGCREGMHNFCVRRDDVDVPPGTGLTRECACTCDPTAPDTDVVSTLQASVREADIVSLVERQTESEALAITNRVAALETRLDRAAGALELEPAATPTERQEIGSAIARFMLAAKDGQRADSVVRTVVEELGPAEAMNVANTLADWSMAIAHRVSTLEKKGGGQ